MQEGDRGTACGRLQEGGTRETSAGRARPGFSLRDITLWASLLKTSGCGLLSQRHEAIQREESVAVRKRLGGEMAHRFRENIAQTRESCPDYGPGF